MGVFSRKNKGDESNDSTQLPAIVTRVQDMYRSAYSAKTSLHEKWKSNYDAYTGKLFENTKGKDRGNAVINHIFSTVETIKPIMFENNPKAIVLPRNEDGFNKAMKVQKALEYEWRRSKFSKKIQSSLTNGLIYGTAIVGMFWNGEAGNGLGEIEPVVISPFNFFLDPMATSIDEAEYVIYATYKSYGELVRAYPDKQEELERNKTSNLDENLTFGKETQNAKNQLLYIECYMRDYAIETLFEDEVDEDGNATGNKYKVSKMKYPQGRRVIIAGDVLLYDGENPYKDGKFPFREWICYEVPGQFWGTSEVEVLISIQREMCELMNDVIDNAHLNGNPIWIMDKNSGVEKNSITNRRGLVVRKNPGTEVKRDAPPSLPAYIQNIISDLKYDIQVVSGVFDATRGERPVSVTAGTAIEALKESSQGRIRLKTQNLEFMLADINSMWLSRIQQFWVVPRTISVMGAPYNPNEVSMAINGKVVALESISRDEVDGDFDIEILTGSSMAVNRSARMEQIIRLAQTPAEDGLPMIDRKTVLEFSELDNVEDIIQRFEKEKLNQEMMQAQQQAMMAQQQQDQMMMQQQADAEAQANDQAMQVAQAQMQHGMDMQKADQQHGQNVQMQMLQALQSGQSGLQSNQEGNGSLDELIQLLAKMSPQELASFVEQRPEMLDLLKAIGEQSQAKGNSQGGKK